MGTKPLLALSVTSRSTSVGGFAGGHRASRNHSAWKRPQALPFSGQGRTLLGSHFHCCR
ncbi:hypothetical protein ACIQ9P_38740 [Kitasatospora sp. NPDC094019]|uniref:hypothetical protein n=1 Tax=Kitasatospora sp. NPDC094019 TaxID=3364091 RepID=UPI0037F4D691